MNPLGILLENSNVNISNSYAQKWIESNDYMLTVTEKDILIDVIKIETQKTNDNKTSENN